MTPPPRLEPDRPSASDQLRSLAAVIRKHGTCAPAALEHVADQLDAAAPPAEAPAERGEHLSVLRGTLERWRKIYFAQPEGSRVSLRDLNALEAAVNALAAAPAGEHVLRFGPFTVSASDEGGSWSIVVSQGRKVCALVDEAAPAAPAPDTAGEPVGEIIDAPYTDVAWTEAGHLLPVGTKLYTAPRVTGGRPDADWYRRKIMEGADCEPGVIGAGFVFVCSNPNARHQHFADPQGHCPDCVREGLGNWSCALQAATGGGES